MSILEKQIGLGTFPFSGVFSPVKQEEAEAIVKAFIDYGGKYIETAPIYPMGEVDLSRIIKLYNRRDLLIGSKCVLSINSLGSTVSSGKENILRTQCYNELKRIGVDYLDLLEAHITATDTPPYDVSKALNMLKQEGLVRYIGVSNASQSDMQSYLAGGKLDFVQNRYSIIHRNPTESITDICVENNILFNPYQVIERGQLINTNPEAGNWRDGDLRAKKAEYVGDAYERVHKWVVNILGDIARKAGISLEALSIRWVFSKPQVTLPVIGATKVWQVKNNMLAGSDALPESILQEIDDAYRSFSDELQSIFGLSVEEFRGLI